MFSYFLSDLSQQLNKNKQKLCMLFSSKNMLIHNNTLNCLVLFKVSSFVLYLSIIVLPKYFNAHGYAKGIVFLVLRNTAQLSNKSYVLKILLLYIAKNYSLYQIALIYQKCDDSVNTLMLIKNIFSLNLQILPYECSLLFFL